MSAHPLPVAVVGGMGTSVGRVLGATHHHLLKNSIQGLPAQDASQRLKPGRVVVFAVLFIPLLQREAASFP